ncbi:MAG: tRNA pseudouridine(55) synthase TruB [Coriobacteriales bacterium]|jgi:tRNA pseudouridine55 synthase|nr:tRNA pseudouridine(55) synthase TruB [Coriobacteriales bacterium]
MAKPRRGATDLDGVLLIDKPIGLTSHDVVDQIRSLTSEGRVGHAGTLDPAASGLLIVCIGPATRLSERLTGMDKEYLARIAFGSSTSTDDADGEVIASSQIPAKLSEPGFIHSVLDSFIGNISQIPPQFSAIKKQGVPAYRQARKGQTVALEPRLVTIYRLELLAATEASWDIVAEVSKGTYIRSLARDIGAAVGCPAHLAELRRLRIGDWRVAQAYSLDDIAAACALGNINRCFIERPVVQAAE